MNSINDIERLLTQTPAPSVVEGPHREELRKQLLMAPPGNAMEVKRSGSSAFGQMSPALKVAASLIAVVLLVGVGWAAERIYEKLSFKKESVTLEELPHQELALPDGSKLTTTGVVGTVVDTNDPKALASAKRHHEEMKVLIRQKKYKLAKTFQNESGGTEYVYTFTFSDGTEDGMNFSLPLDNVSSWDDYQHKTQEQSRQYQEQVNKAIANGKYRLIDKDVWLIHICTDKSSENKFRVQRIPLPKGEEIALYRPYDLAAWKQATPMPQSTWREHLQAIRDGKLELLDIETLFTHTYEVEFDDGTKRIFSCAGNDPIKAFESKNSANDKPK